MPAAAPHSPRLVSVDALRGLTMAAMIVVNNPGTWSHMHPALRHADWGERLTPADLVFPFFLFLVGVSVPLALGSRRDAGAPRGALTRRILRRGAVLFALGVGLNLFPDFDLATVRIPGVLQRIAVVYVACALAFLGGGRRAWLIGAAALLGGYAALLAGVPVPGVGGPVLAPDASLPAWLDEVLLGAHTWRGPGDPEGVLSTLGAVASGLIGVLAGDALRRTAGDPAAARRTAGRIALAGAGCLAAGLVWGRWLTVAKDVWTPPYALVTAGWALLALAACRAAIDLGGRRRGLGPVLLLGRSALTAYVAAHLVSDVTIRVIRWPDGAGGTVSLHHWLHGRLFASWLPPEAASLTHSLALLALLTGALAWLRRRGVALRI